MLPGNFQICSTSYVKLKYCSSYGFRLFSLKKCWTTKLKIMTFLLCLLMYEYGIKYESVTEKKHN